ATAPLAAGSGGVEPDQDPTGPDRFRRVSDRATPPAGAGTGCGRVSAASAVPWSPPPRPGSFLLPRRWGNFRVLRPLGPPLLHLVRLVRRRVQLDQPVEGFGQPPLVPRLDRPLPLLHALVALQEQQLGLGVLLLAQQRPAEQRLGLECLPVGPEELRPGGHALPEIRLRF